MAKAYIISKEWEYVGTYEDAGISGRTMDRPALKGMMSAIEAGMIDVVVVFKLDRLSRRQRDALIIIEDCLLAHEVELVSPKETLDTSTPWGRAMIGILASFNQLECENIKQRTSACRSAKAREGRYAGGRPPFGYKVVNGELEIEPREAEAVRKIFEMREKRATMQKIADWLNDTGMTTHSGGRFGASTVQTILNNRDMYEGKYSYGSDAKSVEGHHEAILEVVG